MVASIPASAIVSVQPAVIDAGGSGLDLVGLFLTDSARAPTNTVLSFASASDVSAYFGPLSTEATLAAIYFAGYDGSTIKPAALRFYRYVDTAAAAFLRGASLSGVTLTQLQGYTGTLTITIGGTAKTSGTINLASVTSFSDAATAIQAAFTSPGFTVTYDTVASAFVFTSTATGAAASLVYTSATGSLGGNLKLRPQDGAVTSAGADVATPATAMNALIALTQNFVSFSTTFAPSTGDKVLFSVWADGQNDRFAYVGWDNASAATVSGDTASFGSQVRDSGYSGTIAIYDPNDGSKIAAFLMGAIASLDFGRANGRATMAFRTGNVDAGVTDQTIAANLKANLYNYVGRFATANDRFVFFYPGQISGAFDWIDSWVCQVWMNNAFQLALMGLLTGTGSIPYNAEGYALIEASLRGVIDSALSFGAIRAGVSLSAQQVAEVNAAAGGDIAQALEQQGWFVKVGTASAEVRAARGSPPIKVFYTDGQSVQQINLTSVNVQ